MEDIDSRLGNATAGRSSGGGKEVEGTGLSRFGNAESERRFAGATVGHTEVLPAGRIGLEVLLARSDSDFGRGEVGIGLVCRHMVVGPGDHRHMRGIAGWMCCIVLAGESCIGLRFHVVFLLALSHTGLMLRVGPECQRHTDPVFLLRSGCKQ